MGRLLNCREAMNILMNKLDKARRQLADNMADGIMASDYVQDSQHIMALQARLEEFRKEETRLLMEANRVRHDLKVAHRERELVEKLREQEFQSWRAEQLRKEQNEEDNLSTMRYVRQHN